MTTPPGYSYRYDSAKSMQENVAASTLMDPLRATMGRTSERLRKVQPPGNGVPTPQELNDLRYRRGLE